MQHKIVIQRHRPWLRPLLVTVAAAVLLGGGWAVYGFTRATTADDIAETRDELDQLREERARLDGELRQSQTETQRLREQLQRAQRGSDVDAQACATLRKSLSELQLEAADLREQLALLGGVGPAEAVRPAAVAVAPRNVTVPEPAARSGIRVQELRLKKTTQPDRYQYLLKLSQSGRPDKPLTGRVEFVIDGRLDDEETRVELRDSAIADKKNLLFSQPDLEEFSGEFALPTGLEPSRLIVALVPSGANARRTEQSFDWTRILANGGPRNEVRK